MKKRNQVLLPINFEAMIPEDDAVRLLVEICDELDYTNLYKAYDRKRRSLSPETMFEILVYGYMRGIYSTRALEEACRRDICFMWILQNEPVPDHSTISRFMSKRLCSVIEELFYQLIMKLYSINEIAFENMFVDGTKIEANANRYTFVWAKAVKKHLEKLEKKTDLFAETIRIRYGLNSITSCETLKEMKIRAELLNIEFVKGKGKHKTQLQKDFEILEEYIKRQKKYIEQLGICGKRKSYSKTDISATFMRMKDDHMQNGQLKPGYNVQIGVESEYIIGLALFPNPSDVNTLVPFLERFKEKTNFKVDKIIADAGYESEENYVYLKENNQKAFIKPKYYEKSKTKKYKQNIFRAENLYYDKDKDFFVCPNGKELKHTGLHYEKSGNGYLIEKKVYQNDSCENCPYRNQCHKSEKDYRTIKVSKNFEGLSNESLNNITSEEGILLRVNRSIQVEGAFGVIKQDMNFRRFILRGKENTEMQFFILAMAFNIQKLHNKTQSGRNKQHLFELKAA